MSHGLLSHSAALLLRSNPLFSHIPPLPHPEAWGPPHGSGVSLCSSVSTAVNIPAVYHGARNSQRATPGFCLCSPSLNLIPVRSHAEAQLCCSGPQTEGSGNKDHESTPWSQEPQCLAEGQAQTRHSICFIIIYILVTIIVIIIK